MPGVELNLEHDQVTMDLLGYFFDCCPGEEMQAELAELRRYRDERNARILERLAELGLPVDADELADIAEDGAAGRPHIGEAMRRRGYVDSISEAFARYLRPRRPRLGRPPPAVAAAGRPAAPHVRRPARDRPPRHHPHRPRRPRGDRPRGRPRRASPASSATTRCTTTRPSPPVAPSATATASSPTGGSDFHGDVKPDVRLGHADGGRPVADELLESLRRRATERPAG